jgi:hypothetical protein
MGIACTQEMKRRYVLVLENVRHEVWTSGALCDTLGYFGRHSTYKLTAGAFGSIRRAEEFLDSVQVSQKGVVSVNGEEASCLDSC